MFDFARDSDSPSSDHSTDDVLGKDVSIADVLSKDVSITDVLRKDVSITDVLRKDVLRKNVSDDLIDKSVEHYKVNENLGLNHFIFYILILVNIDRELQHRIPEHQKCEKSTSSKVFENWSECKIYLHVIKNPLRVCNTYNII
jgi:hypothetical protein